MQSDVCVEEFTEILSLKIAFIPIFSSFSGTTIMHVLDVFILSHISLMCFSAFSVLFFSLGLIWIFSICPSLTPSLFSSVWTAVEYLFWTLNWSYFIFNTRILIRFFLWIPCLCLFFCFIIQNNHGESLLDSSNI